MSLSVNTMHTTICSLETVKQPTISIANVHAHSSSANAYHIDRSILNMISLTRGSLSFYTHQAVLVEYRACYKNTRSALQQ